MSGRKCYILNMFGLQNVQFSVLNKIPSLGIATSTHRYVWFGFVDSGTDIYSILLLKTHTFQQSQA